MLKKSLSILMLISLLTLTACQTSQAQTQFTLSAFQSTITVMQNEEQIIASLDYVSPTEINLTFSSPESLAGMIVCIVDGEKVLSLDSVQINLNEVEALTLSDNVISALYEVLGNFGSCEQLIAQTGKINCEGESINGDYVITFNCDEMKIDTLSIGEYLYIFT